MFSFEKIKDDPNSVHVYMLIAVFQCFEPEASRMHFWQGTVKCKNGTLKH